MENTKTALFVCLGNTCRSPIAEAVFLHLIRKKRIESKWKVDSAAIMHWHVGKEANPRSLAILKAHNLTYNNKSRQINPNDFITSDFIFGMDEYNIMHLNEYAQAIPGAKAKILLLGDFDPLGERIIEDPFCDRDTRKFEKCFQQCMRSCEAFLESQEVL